MSESLSQQIRQALWQSMGEGFIVCYGAKEPEGKIGPFMQMYLHGGSLVMSAKTHGMLAALALMPIGNSHLLEGLGFQFIERRIQFCLLKCIWI